MICAEAGTLPVRESVVASTTVPELRAMRKPLLLFRLYGLLLFRFETVQLFALLFHEPPRMRRLEPSSHPWQWPESAVPAHAGSLSSS